MSRLLLIHHSPTDSLLRLLHALRRGATHPDLDGAVEVVERPALEVVAEDVLFADGERSVDGVLCLSPVNFGYISGALKHVFDQHFRTWEDRTAGLPYAAVLKGTTDADGAVRALEAITTGLRWRRVVPPLAIEGPVTEEVQDAAAELAATVAASLVLPG